MGDTFEILLWENPKAGYTWDYVHASLKATGMNHIVRSIGTTYTHDVEKSEEYGGVRKIEFVVIGTGSGELRLYRDRESGFLGKYEAGNNVADYMVNLVRIEAADVEL